MAQEKIIIRFEPQGDEKLIRAINRLSEAQVRLTGGVNKYTKSAGVLDTRNKRNADSLNNLGLAFSTLRSKALLASFALGVFMRPLNQMVKDAAKVDSMSRAFDTLSGGVGKSSIAFDRLRHATNNTMTEMDLFRQANNAMILGVSKNSEEMAEMFDIAQRLGRALGQDTATSVESLITGIGRQSRLMLDNIGIIVKAEEAYEAYASTLGKTADKLTDAEKKQAFFEATMSSARAKVAELGDEQLTTNDTFQQLATSSAELRKEFGEMLLPLFESVAVKLNDMNIEMTRFLRLLRGEGAEIDPLKTFRDMLPDDIDALKLLLSDYEGELEKVRNKSKEVGETFEITTDNLSSTSDGFFQITGVVDQSNQAFGDYGLILGEADEKTQNFINTLMSGGDVGAVITDEFFALNEETTNFANNIGGIDQNTTDLIEKINILKEAIINYKNENNNLNKSLSDNEDNLRKQIQLAENMADAIGRSVLNANNFADAIGRIGDAIIAEAARVVANQAARWFLKSALGMIGGPFAGIAAGMNLIFHQGGLVPEKKPVQRFATGGTVQGGDNVPILAQGGEFVMSRSAVESIGIENLNRMNQGGGGAINVSIQGNLLTEEYVETELAEKISTAVRRGVDFGIS